MLKEEWFALMDRSGLVLQKKKKEIRFGAYSSVKVHGSIAQGL